MYCMMTVKSMSIGKQSQNLVIFGNLEIHPGHVWGQRGHMIILIH